MSEHLPLYRIDLGYQGTEFFGWQSQLSGNTVQDHLERALAVFLRHPVRVTGASRTDTGVHAQHQVATFRTLAAYEPLRWLKSLEHLLPKSIGVRAIQPSSAAFHPGRSARGKVYLYRIWRGPTVDPFAHPYVWRIMPEFDVSRLVAEAEAFCGRHDFTAFCATDSSAKTRVREVFAIKCQSFGPELRIWVAGGGFLKQQIRIMVGTLIDVARGKRELGTVRTLLASGDRAAAGRTAPGNGLTLMRIIYDDSTLAVLDDLMGTSRPEQPGHISGIVHQ